MTVTWPVTFEGDINAKVSYQFKLDGDLPEGHVRAEVARRYPGYWRVWADHYERREDPPRPAYWTVAVTLRREW